MVSRPPSSPLPSIARLGAEEPLPSRSGRRGGGAAVTAHDTQQPPPGTASPAGASRRHVCAARAGRGGIAPPQPAPSVAPPPGRARPLVCCQWDQACPGQSAREAARGVMARQRSAAQICISRPLPWRPLSECEEKPPGPQPNLLPVV